MTPLDCALQRGFRSTAKYLQLHGGVPATRLTGPAMEAQVSSSMSLQIRDDVTFWGESSTESEEDKVREAKSAKKVHKRKVSMRNRKKKAAQSESDAEAVKAETKDKKVVTTVNSSTNTITSESPRKTAGSSRINYSNEITINGRTEISVHQTQEIIVDGEGAANNSSPGRKVEIDTTETIVMPAESAGDKVKRPKSAKVNTLDPEEEPQMGQSTDDTTMDTVIDTHKLKTEMKVATLELPDISNTSEETEGPKELVVEASVHTEPTKTTNEEVTEEPPVKSILKTTEPPTDQKDKEEAPQAPPSVSTLKQEVIVTTGEETDAQIEEEKPVDIKDEEKPTVTEAVKKEEIPVLEELAKNLAETSTEMVLQPEVKLKRKEPEPVQTEKQEITTKTPKKTDEPFKEPHRPTKEDTTAKSKLQKPDTKRKPPKTRFKKTEQPAIIKIFKTDDGQSEDMESTPSELVSDSMEQASKTHKSFKVLSERQAKELQFDQKGKKSKLMKEDEKKPRSKSDDTKFRGVGKQFRGSKIPTVLSKSERQLDTLMARDRRTHSEIETRIPSLPNIHASTRDRYVSFQSGMSMK